MMFQLGRNSLKLILKGNLQANLFKNKNKKPKLNFLNLNYKKNLNKNNLHKNNLHKNNPHKNNLQNQSLYLNPNLLKQLVLETVPKIDKNYLAFVEKSPKDWKTPKTHTQVSQL